MQVILKAEYNAIGPKGFSPTLSGIQCKLRGKCIWSLVTNSWLVEAHPVTSLCTLLPEVVVELTQAGEQHCLMVFSICPISSGGWRLYTLLVWMCWGFWHPLGTLTCCHGNRLPPCTAADVPLWEPAWGCQHKAKVH